MRIRKNSHFQSQLHNQPVTKETGDHGEDYQDPFIAEGLSHLPPSSNSNNPQPTTAKMTQCRGTLTAVKKKHKSLERRWFHHQERWAYQHNREYLMDSDANNENL